MNVAGDRRQSLEDAQAAFLRQHPEYADTASLDELRQTEFARLDGGSHVYLDYTGGGLYADSQLREHVRLLETGVYGNPHSVNPTSAASTEHVERARAAVLRFFRASAEEYVAISPPTPQVRCASSARPTSSIPETGSCSPSTTTTPSTGSASSRAPAAPRPPTCRACRLISVSTRSYCRAT